MSDPCLQEDTLDDFDKTLHAVKEEQSKQAGWFKTSAWVIGVAIMVIGSLSGIILGKLTAIEALLTSNQVSIAEVKKDVQSLEQRVREIEDRHKWLDQNGLRIVPPRR